MTDELIDWDGFEAARTRFGADFPRQFDWLREEGADAVAAIEAAMRSRSSVALVKPAGTLKDAAFDFGAEALGEAAERIELAALHAVRTQEEPDELLPVVASLRRLFEDTLTQLDQASSPLLQKVRAV